MSGRIAARLNPGACRENNPTLATMGPSRTWGTRGFVGVIALEGGLGAGYDAVVVVLVERDDARGAEVVLRGFAAGFGHCFEAMLIAEQGDGGGGHGLG